MADAPIDVFAWRVENDALRALDPERAADMDRVLAELVVARDDALWLRVALHRWERIVGPRVTRADDGLCAWCRGTWDRGATGHSETCAWHLLPARVRRDAARGEATRDA